jgi:DNA primase
MQRGKILYNAKALYADSTLPIIAVEGVFDALPYWPHAVAFLGKPSYEQIEMLYETDRPVVVVLDGDAWRESWALAERLKLAGKKAAMVRLPPKTDPNDVDRKWLVLEARKAIAT